MSLESSILLAGVLYISGFALVFHFLAMTITDDLLERYPTGLVPSDEVKAAALLTITGSVLNPAVIVVVLVLGMAGVLAGLYEDRF